MSGVFTKQAIEEGHVARGEAADDSVDFTFSLPTRPGSISIIEKRPASPRLSSHQKWEDLKWSTPRLRVCTQPVTGPACTRRSDPFRTGLSRVGESDMNMICVWSVWLLSSIFASAELYL